MKKKSTTPFRISVRTPERSVASVRATSIAFRGFVGELFALQPGCQPTLRALPPGTVVLSRRDGPSVEIDVSWGTLTVAGRDVRLLLHDAELRVPDHGDSLAAAE